MVSTNQKETWKHDQMHETKSGRASTAESNCIRFDHYQIDWIKNGLVRWLVEMCRIRCGSRRSVFTLVVPHLPKKAN